MRTARLVLLLMLLATAAFADKSYRVPAVNITADLAEDGSMQVREERTYRFKGRFKFAFRTFAVDERITYQQFQVSENGQPYTLSDSEEPGTYKVTRDADEIEVRWFYRARNETRTFAIDYTVQDAVHRHRDAAVLYYQFIGEGFRKKTGQLDITVNPPAPVEDWKVRQWAHGPLWAASATSPEGVVTATCTKLPRRRFFELRILYPPELFPAAFEREGYISASVTEEEAAWAEQANAKRLHALEEAENLKQRQLVAIWVLPVVVALFWAYFMHLSREQKSLYPDQPTMSISTLNPPDDVPPALVGYLLNSRTVAPSSLMATLMDLGRRGFVEFREEFVAKKNFLGKEEWEAQHRWELTEEMDRHNLEPYEKDLLEFVFEKMPGQKVRSVDVAMFKKKHSQVQSFFGQWSRKIKKEGERRQWFAEDSFKARNKGLWLGAAQVILGVAMLVLTHAVGLIALIPGGIMMVAASTLVRPTMEGARQIARWKGLRRHLKRGEFRQEDSARMGTFFIYGVLFGMSQGRMQELGGLAKAGDNPMVWYYPAHGHHGGDFGASFSTAVATVSSAMSSSTGSGGGASGGGGGGAGGGGGGAG